MRAEPSENTAPTALNSAVKLAPTTAATQIDRARRGPIPDPVTSSRKYRPRYAGTRAKPQGLNAATAPRTNA